MSTITPGTRTPGIALEGRIPDAVAEAVGEASRIKTRAIDRVAYASDASHFLLTPHAVVVAEDAAEVARVLRPGGRWVFAVTHPIRWAFPDDPGVGGLTATRSYFDRTPYVEIGESGAVLYAEYHRTLGDHVGELAAAGFVLDRLVEPEWPAGHDRTWGGWGPVRGARLPGTAIFVTHLGPPAR